MRFSQWHLQYGTSTKGTHGFRAREAKGLFSAVWRDDLFSFEIKRAKNDTLETRNYLETSAHNYLLVLAVLKAEKSNPWVLDGTQR
jgi:hypothetical protein